MAVYIDGKAIASQIKDELKETVAALCGRGRQPCLAVIQVGDDPASQIYVRNKKKACEYIGIKSLSFELGGETREEELLTLIRQLNADRRVHGILVQLPLPDQIDKDLVIKTIAPTKDVDGFHPISTGNLLLGAEGFLPCTPAGVIQLLKRSEISIAGKECVVVGRSNIVGKPMALLLLQENGTVTVAHSGTANLKEVTRRADILIAAMGQPVFITEEYVKEGAVVIDIGIHRDDSNQLCGDVDFAGVVSKVSAITPVPGGVGPMTVAMLMYNCVKAVKNS